MSVAEREELRQLAYDYARCVDRCDAEGLVAIFTADGLVGASDPAVPAFVGEAGLRRMIAQVDAMFVKTMHNVFNHTFDHFGPGEVHGETTCVASHIVDDGAGGWKVFDMALRYANRYRRVGGRWRFAERRLTCEWVETRPVERFNPQGLAMLEVDA
ncbi:nuclear transport factor 2 family protein [Leptolyngbya sp. 15MV]|nr:nuclear transport factor 2 family protein [Leptolyngbya sp. 15MV]